jgi:hypothetical protein
LAEQREAFVVTELVADRKRHLRVRAEFSRFRKRLDPEVRSAASSPTPNFRLLAALGCQQAEDDARPLSRQAQRYCADE